MITLNGSQTVTMDLIRLIILNQFPSNILPPSRCNVYDEKWIMPKDEGLFVTIEYRGGKCIANRNTFVNTSPTGTPQEVQDVNMFEDITVGIFSRDRSATLLKEQILMAIMSSYSEYVQNCASFKIARNADIQDLSALEGSAMLKRYDIDLKVFTWYENIITPPTLTPPFEIQVIADDAANNILEATVTAASQLPRGDH